MAVKNYQNDDRKPYIFKTDDYGKTWTKIVNGIPDNDFVHAVREDPDAPGLLFAGTEHGIYVSFDDGAQWQSICAQSARHAGVRPGDRRQRPGDRHARPLVLRARRHHSAAPVDAHACPPKMPTSSIRPTVERNVNQARIDYYLSKPVGQDSRSTSSMPRVRWCGPSPARPRRLDVAVAGDVAARPMRPLRAAMTRGRLSA